jgi:hypothetical protein
MIWPNASKICHPTAKRFFLLRQVRPESTEIFYVKTNLPSWFPDWWLTLYYALMLYNAHESFLAPYMRFKAQPAI